MIQQLSQEYFDSRPIANFDILNSEEANVVMDTLMLNVLVELETQRHKHLKFQRITNLLNDKLHLKPVRYTCRYFQVGQLI